MAEESRTQSPAINGKFGFTLPFQWLAKLTFDLDLMERSLPGERLDRVFHTMNFVVSAWQMCDWVWEASDVVIREAWAIELTGLADERIAGRKDFRAKIKGRSIYMRVCAAIANELKHYSASSESTDDPLVDSWSIAMHRIAGDEGSPRDWRAQFRFHDEVINDVDLCRGTLAFWAYSLAKVGLLEKHMADMVLRQCQAES